MEMELDEVQYLLALRQLYGLLQNIGNGLQDKSSENLGENGRLLLKNLLDNAAQRILGCQSKTVAARSCGSSALCPSFAEPPTVVPKLNLPVSPPMQRAFSSAAQSTSKEWKCRTVSSRRDERPPMKPALREAVSELSKSRISSNIPEQGRKRCGVCKQGGMKFQNQAKETKISGEKATISNKGAGYQDEVYNQSSPFCVVNAKAKGSKEVEERAVLEPNPSLVGCSSCSANGVGHGASNKKEKKEEETHDFSEDASKAVERIESRLTALQLRYHSPNATKTKVGLNGHLVGTKEGLVTRSYAGEPPRLGRRNENQVREQLGRVDNKNDSSLRTPSKVLRQHHNPIDWPSGLASQTVGRESGRGNAATESGEYYVHGLRVPVDHGDLPKRPQRMVSEKNWTTAKNAARSTNPVGDGGHKPKTSRGRETKLQMLTRPTLLYHEPSSETTTTTYRTTEARTKVLPRRHDGGSSESYFSSSSCQTSPTYRSITDSGSSTSQTQYHQKDPASASMARESSIVESSSGDQYTPLSHSRNRVGATRRNRSGRRRNPGKVIGRLRRFKNELGLIFHHHHHHHHHHHLLDNRDGGSRKSLVVHKHSRSNPLQKIFDRANAHEVHDRAVQKMKKSSKQHVGHFNTLVEGLLRHVRRQKRPKTLKAGIGWSRDGPHVGGKKMARKSHWWQMFGRYGAVKLPKRRRVRVGFIRQKPRLKMS